MDVSLALKNPGQSYPFEMDAQVSPMVVLSDPVEFSSVRLKGALVGASESVRLMGTLEADVVSRCALCLEPVKKHLTTEADALYAKEPDPEDPDQYPLDGYKIDVQPLIEELLVLELPMRFLCSETCKGICPICGTNRNIAPCSCQEGGERRSPFSALSELLTEDEEV